MASTPCMLLMKSSCVLPQDNYNLVAFLFYMRNQVQPFFAPDQLSS
jgi:hypothetical protein